MRFSIRHLALFPCLVAFVALTGLSTSARADSIANGSVWEGATSYPNSLSITAPSGTPTATFTVDAASGNVFSFQSGSSNNLTLDPTYTLAGFLTSGGDSLNFLTGSSHAGDSINNDVFEFTGYVDLAPGTYTITHDDGMYLWINGVLEINSGAPTAADASHFTITTDTGFVPFEILYAEVNGAPAELSGNIGKVSPTPEPSSFILLGSGLLAAAGVVRRRFNV